MKSRTKLSLAVPTTKQLKIINGTFNEKFRKDDICICKFKLADNKIDDDFTRFTKDCLDSMQSILKNNKIMFKEYSGVTHKPFEFLMTIFDCELYEYGDECAVTCDYNSDCESLFELYVFAYVPRQNLSTEFFAMLEDGYNADVLLSLIVNDKTIKKYKTGLGNTIIEIIDPIRLAELALIFPCRDEWKCNDENILKDNSMKSNSAKDCCGCMGAAFGDCAECDERTSITGSTTSTTISEDASEPSFNANQIKTKEIAKLVVPVSAVLEPITVIRGSDTALLRLTKAEINDIIDFIECNFKNDLLDSEWDGNINYPACIIGLYQKFKKAKDYIEKNIGGDSDEKS